MVKIYALFVVVITFLQNLPLHACGDVLIKTQDGTMINARSMEFALPLDSSINAYPRKEIRKSYAPDGKSGLTWISKYGYIGIDALGVDAPCDGINEKGLSIGALWLPTTVYQTVPKGKLDKSISVDLFCAWVLGTCANIQDVKEMLPKIFVWGKVIPKLQMIPPLHFAIHDAQGNNLVVEFINGIVCIHDNPIGVLTNYPTFNWHLDNLRNFAKLSPPNNAQPVIFTDTTIKFIGEGSGLLGLPGDYSPASRFIKLAYFTQCATQVAHAQDGITLATHIFNTVDIPLGIIRETDGKPSDYTQWVVIKDLTNKVFYYRTYSNLSLQSIDLKALNFEDASSRSSISMENSFAPINMTQELQRQVHNKTTLKR